MHISPRHRRLTIMPNAPKLDERVGWELIWRRGNEHPRYGSYAAPDAAVMDWATALPAGGFILDLGCGVGRHVVYLGGCGFRMAGIDISPGGLRLPRGGRASPSAALVCGV